MNLYYVRHGKTQGNLEKNYIGRTESPLIEEGVQAAIDLGQEIHSSGLHFDVIYTSSLERQRKTAELIAQEIGYPVDAIIRNDLLLERAGGSFEGKPQSEFFAATEEEQVAAGAEPFRELANRAIRMVEIAEQAHPNGTVLFVGSAAIGEMMRAMIKYEDHTRMFEDGPLPNSKLIQLI
jgi:broad specificity phosphatase PhoE